MKNFSRVLTPVCWLVGVVFTSHLLLLPHLTEAAQVTVNCNSPSAKFRTIKSALAGLPSIGPNTLRVSGSCKENVSIQGFDRLTIQGNPTATIDGGSDPNFNALDILESHEVTVSSITITGGGIGVQCSLQSLCRLDAVTVQNSLGPGIFVGNGAFAFLNRSTVQNNGADGLTLASGSTASVTASTLQGNNGSGLSLAAGAGVTVARDQETGTIPTVIQNNGGDGVLAGVHTGIALHAATISGNGGDGVAIEGGSGGVFDSTTITNNIGHGVRIGDLSFASFIGSNNITGNNPNDIVCDPSFSATRGILGVVANGSTTNCPPPLPRNP